MSWPRLSLEKLADISGGGTPRRNYPEYWGGAIPWLTPTDLPAPGTDIATVEDSTERITERGLQESGAQLLPAGTVLFSSRATIGKLGIAAVPVTTNQGFANFTPLPGVNSRYLAYALQYFINDISALAGSITFKEVTRSAIRQFTIPYPPPSEQRRIVGILDAASELRKRRAAADTRFLRILSTFYFKMFGDPIANPRALKKKQLGALITLKSGDFLPSKEMVHTGEYPVYGGNGITGYHSAFMFPNRVIVLGRVGAYCGVVHHTEPNCWVTDNALYVSEMSPELDPIYLVEALRIADLNRYAGRAGQPLISGSRVYPVEILVPDIPQQQAFARMVTDVDGLRSTKETAAARLHRLFELLLQKAFTGELTASWRNANMKELLDEMREHMKALQLPKEVLSC